MAKQDPKLLERREALRKPITLFFTVGCILAIIFLYYTNLVPVWIRFIIALAVLFITGIVISTANMLQNFFYGSTYLLGGKYGIGIIEKLSKYNKNYWKFFAEWGSVVSFGLLSYIIFRRKISSKAVVLGLATNLVILILVLPNIGLPAQLITVPGLGQLITGTASLQGPIIGYPLELYVLAILGGFLGFLVALFAIADFGILLSISTAVASTISGHPNYTQLSQQIPGVVPAIPGITLPFFAGILSLAGILIVHEFSHGVFTRIAKVKIKRVGLLLFGIIPLGAFVEPDEKHVDRLDKDKQNDIFIAGVSANFLATIIFFVLTAFMVVYLMPYFFKQVVIVTATIPGYPANNVILPGSIITVWNGYQINNLSSFTNATKGDTPYSQISLVADNKSYSFQTNATGKIGVYLSEKQIARQQGPQNWIINLIYGFLALSFGLNFFIAVINLLPVPGFDGWRIYKNRIKSQKLLLVFSYLSVIMIVILALPWLWTL